MPIKIVAQTKVGEKGPSFTCADTDSTFIVRQGTKLQRFDFQTQKRLAALDLPQFQSTPCAVHAGWYYELTDNGVIKVNLVDMKQEPTFHSYRFFQSLVNSPSIQFDRALLVLDGQFMHVCYLDSSKQVPMCQIPVNSGTTRQIFIQSRTQITILDDTKLYSFESMQHLFQVCDKRPYRDGRAAPIRGGSAIMVFGPSGDGCDPKCIYEATLDGTLGQPLFTGKGSLGMCTFYVTDTYCLITDQTGRFMVLQDELFADTCEVQKALQFSTKAEFKMAHVGKMSESGRMEEDVEQTKMMEEEQKKAQEEARVAEEQRQEELRAAAEEEAQREEETQRQQEEEKRREEERKKEEEEEKRREEEKRKEEERQ